MCGDCQPTARLAGPLSRRTFHAGLLSAAALTAAPRAHAADPLIEPVLRLVVPPEAPRTVALTLDACAGETDLRILDTITGLAVPATIFATGLWLDRNAAALAALRAHPDLFTLQNHGERHVPPVLGITPVYGLRPAGTLEAVQREVARGAEAVAATGAPRPRWYRGATGRYSPGVIASIEAAGFAIAGYSLTADAGASLPAETVARRITMARSGEIIVAHINQPRRSSGAGVAEGIRLLHQEGVHFVGLDTLPTTRLSV